MGRDAACPNAAAAAAAAAANTAKTANQLKVQVLLWKAGTRVNNEYGVLDFVQSVRMCALVKLGDQAFEKSESVVVCYCCCLFI